ncbi:MAG: N-formylglutamate amidohydrolase [Pseudomonadota bacterium]
MRSSIDVSPESHVETVEAFTLRRDRNVRAPVIFASPHSGNIYPQEMRDLLCVPIVDLQRTEDAFVDELYLPSIDQGAILLSANYARGFVDLNRDSRELDASMFHDGLPRTAGMPSPRVKAGLGCLPRVGASGREIYAAPMSKQAGQFRLVEVYDRYHQALQQQIEALKSDWSDIVIIDCHSMPSRQPGRSNLPDIVLGDRFGSSCSARLTSCVERFCRRAGLSVTRNAPYAGGYTTRRYGRPRRGIHVLQIEINRALYMNEVNVEKSAGFVQTREQVCRLIEDIVDYALRENL